MAKNKNLESANNSNDDILSEHKAAEAGVEAFDLDADNDFIDEEDIMPKFSLVEDDEEDDQEPDIEEDDEDQDEEPEELDDQEDEEPQEDVKPTKANNTSKLTSKEEKAIVALKREQKKLREENRKMQEQLAEKDRTKKQTSLKQKYIDEGHDEATANYMAQQDIRTQQQQERLDLLEFKDQNFDILSRYPDATKDIARIKRTVEAAGITVEQACRGLYGTDRPDYERRARERIAIDDEGDDNAISRASRAGTAPKQSRLTAQERKAKQYIETKFLNGEKLSDKEFLKHYKKG